MQTEHPNVTQVRRAYAQYAEGNPDFLELYDKALVWHYENPGFLAGDYRGRDEGYQEFVRTLLKAVDSFRLIPLSIVAFGDEFVIAHHRIEITRNGQTSTGHEGILTFRFNQGGKVVEVWDIPRSYP